MKTLESLLLLVLSSSCSEAPSPSASAPSPRSTPAPASAPMAQAPAAPRAPGQGTTGGAPSARTPVRIEPGRLDFGFVQPHTKLEGEARIVNDTDQPVRILKAVPSCQCTTVDLDGKVVPARDSLAFPVSMKVSSTGQKLADVRLIVEGMETPLRIELRAEVVYAIRAVTQNKPGGSWDPFIDADTDPLRVRGEVTVGSLDGKPFRVLSVGLKPPQFLDWDPSKAPKSSYRVRYDIASRDCDSMPKYLIIETDRPEAPLIDMRVRHKCTHIRPKIQLAEFRANAGVMSPSKPGTFELEIKKVATPAGRIEIKGVTSSRPDITTELVDQKFDGENLLITVRMTPKAGTTGVFFFPVRLQVALPGQPAYNEDLLVYGKAVPDA